MPRTHDSAELLQWWLDDNREAAEAAVDDWATDIHETIAPDEMDPEDSDDFFHWYRFHYPDQYAYLAASFEEDFADSFETEPS